MATSKPKIIKNFDKLDEHLKTAINEAYPNGFASELQTFDVGGGKFMTALPFETEEFYYLIKIPVPEDIDDNLDDLNIDPIDVDDDSEDMQDEKLEESMDELEQLEVVDESSEV